MKNLAGEISRLTLTTILLLTCIGACEAADPQPPKDPHYGVRGGSALAADASAPIPRSRSSALVPGEESALTVEPIASVRFPRVDIAFVGSPDLTALAARSASQLQDALNPAIAEPSARETVEEHKIRTAYIRARTLAPLAQAPFSDEPPERRGRLRGTALLAAISAHDELRDTGFDQASRCKKPCMDRGWLLYFSGLLNEQANNLQRARSFYLQAMEVRRTTLAGTHPRWELADGLCHVGLAELAARSEDPSRETEVKSEYEAAVDAITQWESIAGVDIPGLKSYIVRRAGEKKPELATAMQERIDKRERERGAAQIVTESWEPLEDLANKAAQRIWIAEHEKSRLAELPPLERSDATRRLQVTMRNTSVFIEQKYCPARAKFALRFGQSEFAKRAANHCRDNPPIASAEGRFYAGAETGEVSLAKQCGAVHAYACP